MQNKKRISPWAENNSCFINLAQWLVGLATLFVALASLIISIFGNPLKWFDIKQDERNIESLAQHPTDIFKIRIITSSKFKNARIFLDNNEVAFKTDTPNVKILHIRAKKGFRKIILSNETESCVIVRLIESDIDLVCD